MADTVLQIQGTDAPEAKNPRQRRCNRLVTYLEEYCARSSLHGLQYVGDKQTPTLDRVIWMLVWISSMILGGVLIGQVYHKWDTSPVIVSLAPSETPIWKIPFPAVTVCDNTKARASVFNFTDAFSRYEEDLPISDEELSNLETISLACVLDSHDWEERSNDTSDTEAVRTLIELGTGKDMIGYFKYSIFISELKQWDPVLTEEGVCYTYNMLGTGDLYRDEVVFDPPLTRRRKQKHPPSWTMTSSYVQKATLFDQPLRAFASGLDRGLELHLKSKREDRDDSCRRKRDGFKMMLHNPGEMPNAKTRFLDLPLNSEMNVAVTPSMIVTSDNLKNYSPLRRQCNFPSDRQLRFYRDYTQEKCNSECLTNFTLLRCDCVPFYMPRTEDMELCGTSKSERKCISKAKYDMQFAFLKIIKSNLEKSESSSNNCDCLPACTDLTYDVETSIRTLEKQDPLNTSLADESVVHIYLKVENFIVSQRSELFGMTEFIAYTGGTLGLFLGFSLLSLCEIFYFASLRACRALW